MTSGSSGWTNPSVTKLAAGADPVEVLTNKARQLVRQAMDAGWTGPPFDPIALAEIMKIPVVPRDDVRDARTVPVGQSSVRIEFNPNRPPMRVRYSLAHEIAHTLFPDCSDLVRNRAAYHELTGDDSQLEALCNIGAAEILMPAGTLLPPADEHLSAETIVDLRRQFEVSTEALVIRLARMSLLPQAAFCASRAEVGSDRFRIDYLIGSATWSAHVRHGSVVPASSVVTECRAIGHTASGKEMWGGDSQVSVQCVAIPPYPRRRNPRVVGLTTQLDRRDVDAPLLVEVRGDALEPRGNGARIITHVVNDATANWGGGGFAAALRKKYPAVQEDFRSWSAKTRDAFKLGGTHFSQIDPERGVFHMVAQHGYGESARPRIRYLALQQCLEQLADFAVRRKATVHMPRIGTGLAGGGWHIIRDMVSETLSARGVRVTVYTPPNQTLSEPEQVSLGLWSHRRGG